MKPVSPVVRLQGYLSPVRQRAGLSFLNCLVDCVDDVASYAYLFFLERVQAGFVTLTGSDNPEKESPMKRNFKTIALLLTLLSAAAGTANAADPDLGRNLAATCAACHGTDGRTAGINANLAGVAKDTLIQTLKAFKSGEKPATVMHQLAKGYTDAQLDAIAGYLAAQPK
jgi:sulfide dehydrogenase cytochrome subunit